MADHEHEEKGKPGLHTLALKRFDIIESLERDNRVAALDDLKFAYNIDNGQWPKEIRDERNAANRPCLTSNKLKKFVKQVANKQRDQRLAGKVRAVDDRADVLTAKVMEGLIRQIERASNAENIYVEAGEKAIAGGFGYWRIYTQELDDSFDQEAFIGSIENQFNAWLDPHKMYGFICETLPKEEFKEQWPNATFDNEFASPQVGAEDDDTTDLWYQDERIRVAEYFYKKRYDKEIAQIVDPETLQTAIVELVKDKKDAVHGKVTREMITERGLKIVDIDGTEKVKTSGAYKVRWAKLTGHEVLEEGDWVGKEIPIIEVRGDWVNIAGKVHKQSLIRDAKDPQMGYNFWKTNMAETVALVPKSPWIAKAKAIANYIDKWETANVNNYSVLEYDGPDKPFREPPATIPTGAAAMMQTENADIMDVIGMFEGSFGQKSNERTGVAIKQRASRSDFGTFHFHDNFGMAIVETVRQLLDIIPKIYDTKRTVRILGEDDAQAMDIINMSSKRGVGDAIRRHPGEEEGRELLATINTENGVDENLKPVLINNLSYGKYDAVPGVKLMSTRRQEQLDGMKDIAAGSPQMGLILLPEMARMSDWPGAQKIADLAEKTLAAMFNKPSEGGAQPEGSPGE